MLVCHRFTSWSQINALASQKNSTLFSFPYLSLQASSAILFTTELQMSSLLLSAEPFQAPSLLVYAVTGLQVYPLISSLMYHERKADLYVLMSRVEFYVSGSSAREYTCSADLIPAASNANSMFSLYDKITLEASNIYPATTPPLCPYLFRNAALTVLDLDGQVVSFLLVNQLRFDDQIEANTSTTSTIAANVAYLDVKGYNYQVDTGLLHPLVFELLTDLSLYNTIGSLDSVLFATTTRFQHLTQINLHLDSVGNFYHKIGIAWLNSLSAIQISVDSYVSTFVSIAWNVQYAYPDKDLCLFASFPQNRGIYFAPFNLSDVYDAGGTLDYFVNCTSTLKWLGRNFYNNRQADFLGVYCRACSAASGLSDAQIDQKLALCGNFAAASYDPADDDYYEHRLVNMFGFALVPFVCIPCASLLGLFFSYKITRTIRENEKKELKEHFYKYMSANAKFNCLS
jgi:hypothetical protein